MERELWPLLYRTVRAVAADFTQKYVQIPGWAVLLTLLWAALHDRPVSWACDPDNWKSTPLRVSRLPSPATMSRRVDSVGLGLLWRAVQERLRSANPPASWLSFLDGKPFEALVARRLIRQLAGGGYLLGDGVYDVNRLFDLAGQRGYQLVTPPPKAPPGRRRQSQHRLRSIDLVGDPFGQALYGQRIGIEEAFGNVSSFGGGLGPLPAWVRGP
jgi:hypothetical protein